MNANDWKVVKAAMDEYAKVFPSPELTLALAALARLKAASETESAGNKRAIAELLKADAEIARLQAESAHYREQRRRAHALIDSIMKAVDSAGIGERASDWDVLDGSVRKMAAEIARQRELIAEAAKDAEVQGLANKAARILCETEMRLKHSGDLAAFMSEVDRVWKRYVPEADALLRLIGIPELHARLTASNSQGLLDDSMPQKCSRCQHPWHPEFCGMAKRWTTDSGSGIHQCGCDNTAPTVEGRASGEQGRGE